MAPFICWLWQKPQAGASAKRGMVLLSVPAFSSFSFFGGLGCGRFWDDVAHRLFGWHCLGRAAWESLSVAQSFNSLCFPVATPLALAVVHFYDIGCAGAF